MSVEIITTVLVPASSYDLTDLATVKDELAIPTADTTADTFLKRAITQTSSAIANYCNRRFQVETLQDIAYIEQDPYPYQVPGGVAPLQLARWPIVDVLSVVQENAPGDTTTLTQDTDYKIDAANGRLVSLNPFTGVSQRWPALPITTQYRAGYTKTVTAEQGTVPSVDPRAVTVAQAASFVLDQGVTYQGSGQALTKVASSPAQGQYSVANGVYTFNAADAGVAVLISYLYAAIPDDIVAAALRFITGRFKARGRDPMLKGDAEGGLGTQQFWVGPLPGQSGAFAPEVASLLDNYRVPVVA